jgi:spore germination cell wall hydrolase CwlJ-like protein
VNQSTTLHRQVERKPGVFETIAVRVCQFSWVCEGKKNIRNTEAYDRAYTMAQAVYLNDAYDDVVPSNTLFFHATSVKPGWKLYRVERIGNHVFYSREKPETTDNQMR